MVLTVRPCKRTGYFAIFAAAIFAAAVLGHVSLFFLTEPEKYGFKSEQAAAGMGALGVCLYGIMLLASLYTWAAYHVERLTVDGTRISFMTVGRSYNIDAADVQTLSWQTPLSRAIALHTSSGKAKLELTNYERPARLQVIRALRDLVPEERREHWGEFCHRVALPLRDGVPSLSRANPSLPLATLTRRRYDRLFVVAVPAVAAIGVVLGVAYGLWQLLAMPLVLMAFWLLLRTSIPREGVRQLTMPATELVALGFLPLALLVMVGLKAAGMSESTACWVALPLLIPPVAYMLYRAAKEDLRRAGDKSGLDAAALEWELGEAGHNNYRGAEVS
jgi:hypothetical protein